MSSDPAEGLVRPIDAELSDALIARCNFSTQDIDRIIEAMRARRQSFCEAALDLNLATRDEVEDVSRHVRQARHLNRAGLIETALRQAKGGTALTLRRGQARLADELMHTRDPGNERSEKMRALRTELMLLNGSAQRGNVFALVSPGRGEGRSRLCAELAIAFAQLGRRTLLIDADLRHPRQHALFTASDDMGLAQCLELGESPYLHEVEGIPELLLLSAGNAPSNPLELISSRRFERLVSELRRQFDFIIIDTPALSQYSDALQIATVAQHVLVVSRTSTTSFEGMKDMLRRLTVTGSRTLGAVMSKF